MSSTEVTLTLPNELLALVDQYVKEHTDATRSSVCAEALRDWLRMKLDAEIAAYYLDRSDAERAEDETWNKVSADRTGSLWQ